MTDLKADIKAKTDADADADARRIETFNAEVTAAIPLFRALTARLVTEGGDPVATMLASALVLSEAIYATATTQARDPAEAFVLLDSLNKDMSGHLGRLIAAEQDSARTMMEAANG